MTKRVVINTTLFVAAGSRPGRVSGCLWDADPFAPHSDDRKFAAPFCVRIPTEPVAGCFRARFDASCP